MSVAELRGVGLEVRGGPDVLLRDLDLVTRGGETLGICGPSASGKTSLLHCLGGLAPLAGGELLLDGRPAVPWRDAATSFVFQNLCLVPVLSAEETVGLPLQSAGVAKGEVRARAAGTLERLGLGDHLRQLVGTLSGGQRQRVAVARALAADPDQLLVGEPTSALDEHWREVVVVELRGQARRGAVVIVASGDPALTATCDQTITLDPALA